MSKYDPDDPFGYEGRHCWLVVAVMGAVGMAPLMAVLCLLWRGAAELGWLEFHGGDAITTMAIGCGFGALIGVLEHADRHQAARDEARHREVVVFVSSDHAIAAERTEETAGAADSDEQRPAGGAR